VEETEAKIVRLCVTKGCVNYGPTTDYDANEKCNACGKKTKEHVIAGVETAPIGPAPAPSWAREELIEPTRRKKRMCRTHGKEIDADARFCQYCGINIPSREVSETQILGIAAIGGIFGLHGLGHLSLGRIAIGFLILFGGIALLGGIIACAVQYWFWRGPEFLIVIGILAVAYVFLFVWQVMDANNSARKHNLDYENHKAA
jgi:hypothetical protein